MDHIKLFNLSSEPKIGSIYKNKSKLPCKSIRFQRSADKSKFIINLSLLDEYILIALKLPVILQRFVRILKLPTSNAVRFILLDHNIILLSFHNQCLRVIRPFVLNTQTILLNEIYRLVCYMG